MFKLWSETIFKTMFKLYFITVSKIKVTKEATIEANFIHFSFLHFAKESLGFSGLSNYYMVCVIS